MNTMKGEDGRDTDVNTALNLQRQQLAVAKKQLRYSRFITILLLVLVLALGASTVVIAPKVNSVLADVEEISKDLNNQEPVDTESLNGAIHDLESILSPLAKLLTPQS